MPFVDFDSSNFDGALIDRNFDFTIIGCGAVGIHLALLLAQKEKSILIIESGKVGEHPEKQALNESLTNRRDIKSSIEWGRKRALGGTTIKWGGQALPFQPIDFGSRAWLHSDGWPIPFDDLESHYRKAESYMGVGTNGYFGPDLEGLGLKPPFQSEDLEYHVSKWAPEPNMFQRHKSELEKVATVFYNAHCISVQKANGRCNSLIVCNSQGVRRELYVNKLIIAAGGVESVRFLLVNRLSNSPVLGEGFMEHPCMDLGMVSTSAPRLLQTLFSSRKIRGQKYGIRLSLTSSAQEFHKISNASAGLMFETPEETFEPLRNAKALLRERSLQSFLQMLGHLPDYFTAGLLFFRFGISWRPKARIRLTVMCEQLASAESRIELDKNECDCFGTPKMRITWEIGEEVSRAAFVIAAQVKSALESALPCKVVLRPELSKASTVLNSGVFSSVNHHMGGAVMGHDPSKSVVDADLRTHEFDNIWVCSASTFPTGSHSNPTLTALALGGRLVDHLTNSAEEVV